MKQGLRLLQLTGDELAAEIAAEAAANPLLDVVAPRSVSLVPREAAASAETLTDHLLAQLAAARLNERGQRLALLMIGELEPDGYLRADLAELAARANAPPTAVMATLAILQAFEPTGVFARDLAECLRLQLAERGRLDPMMQGLLGRLGLVAEGALGRLQAELACDRDDLDDMLAELRTLSPAPGLAFSAEPAHTVAPEVRVLPRPGGGWMVESWAPHLPRLVVREGQFERLAARCRREPELAYLRERLSAARRFAELLERRGRTVLEIAAEMVARQETFLDAGAAALKPLSMREVSESLGLHESTVSRAVRDKTMLTPRGVIAFRAFFAAAARTWDRSELTHPQLLARIRELVADTSHGRALSDAAIARRLQAGGIDIARRTVAKHRKALGLPTGPRRRRLGSDPAPSASHHPSGPSQHDQAEDHGEEARRP